MMDGRVFINAEKHYSGVVGSKFLLIHIYIYCPPGEGSTQSCEARLPSPWTPILPGRRYSKPVLKSTSYYFNSSKYIFSI